MNLDMSFFGTEDFYKVLQIDLFEGVKDIYENNFHDLHMVLDNYKTRSKDFLRYLHNYLSSFATLTDHCRVLLKKCHEASETVRKRIQSDLATLPSNNFLKDLRNYTLHHSLPLTMREVKQLDGRLIVGDLMWSRSSLLKWKGWNAQSYLYLNSLEGDIRIKELLVEHYNRIAAFYNWLEEYLLELYSDAFIKYKNLP
ncbi:hypothetical protein LLH06_00460 [Mucilaginibacter daejeonensis]|uniref:hypothetical protein n=1 Tax=Mucilaginibacter daejeonensis TaxID=398049 RepID=UPI001D176174|nr:hypothetical protein [Mucilaginibacter daejeonensis]UEG53449.1 hypothetical protein LLH06_00460 [Mucilaginibacter daejeonensis]